MKKYYMVLLFAWWLAGCRSETSQKPAEFLPDVKPQPVASYFTDAWAKNPLWDDGSAEVAKYAAEQVTGSTRRRFEAVQITEMEIFNKAYYTKTERYDRKDLVEVFKFNTFAHIETNASPVQLASSVFVTRRDPTLLFKMSLSVQDWQGTTFKEFRKQLGRSELSFHSYWDGEGTGSYTLESDVIAEDQLPLTLRSLKFADGLAFERKIMATQLSNRAALPQFYNADFKVSAGDAIEIDDAKIETWKVNVWLEQDKTNAYWFEKSFPNVLVKQTTWDGRNLLLTSRTRDQFWKSKPDSAKTNLQP